MAGKSNPTGWIRVPNGGTPEQPTVYTAIREALQESADSIRALQSQVDGLKPAAAGSGILLGALAGVDIGSGTGGGTGGGGSVTSVDVALSTEAGGFLSVSGGPVVTAGTITLGLDTQAANTVFAGPITGGADEPAFRSLDPADIPNLDAGKITSGQLALARGGTGADLSATGGAGQYVKQASAGAVFTVGTIPASDIASGAALTASDDTNVTLTLGGSPTTALLAATSLTLGWTGTLSMARGGSGKNLTASDGGIVYTDADSMEILAATTTANQVLLSGASSAPAWSTATYPATTTVNQLLYSSANNVIGEITTANSSVLVTDVSGVPSFATDIPTGVTIGGDYIYRVNGTDVAVADGGTGASTNTAAFDNLSPLTTLGDIIYRDGTNNVRLAGNTTTTRQFLRQTGTGSASAAPAWDTVTKTDVGLSNVENTALSTWAGSTNITTLGTVTSGTWNATAIAAAYGGTGQTSYTVGDTLYADSTTTLARLALVSAGIMYGGASAPAWTAAADFTWDQTNKRVGIGTASPTETLTVTGTTYISGMLTSPTAAIFKGSYIGYSTSYTYPTTGDIYRLIALLPESTAGSFDHIIIKAVLDDSFGSNFKSYVTVYMGNRNQFYYAWSIFGDTRGNAGIVAYQNANGSVSIYLYQKDNSFTTISYNIEQSQQVTIYPDPAGVVGVPTGTLVFDSTNPTTYVPRMIQRNDGNTGIGIASPANRLHIYENTSNTGADAGLTVEQNGTGDAVAQFLLTGGQRWVAGIDNSDGDKFKIASDADLDTNARFTITTTGDVGIGTTSPSYPFDFQRNVAGTVTFGLTNTDTGASSDVRLSLFNSATNGGLIQRSSGHPDEANDLLVYSAANDIHFYTNANNRMSVTSTGNVGIGVTDPAVKLDVVNTNATFNAITPGTTKYALHFRAGSTNDQATGITWSGVDSTPTPGAQAGIYVQGSNLIGTKMYFATSNSYFTGAQTAMMIDQNRNVGIGVTDPAVKLDVVNTNATFNAITPGTTKYALHFRAGSTNDQATGITWSGVDSTPTPGAQAGIYVQGSNLIGTKMYFATSNSYFTGAQTAMMIDQNRNVGIGTTSPGYTLELGGSAQIKFPDVDATTNAVGLYWYSPGDYGIFRTAGSWAAPDYQQLSLSWVTGIVLSPGTGSGTGYDKSYVDIITGKGLMVSSGGIGLGVTNPTVKLDFVDTNATFNTTTPGTTPYALHFRAGSTFDYATGITWSGNGSNSTNAHAGIYVQSSGGYGTKMYFATTENFATGAQTAMMIDQNRNVGIGTTSPSYPFDFQRNVAGVVTFGLTNTDTGASSDVRLSLFNSATNGGLIHRSSGHATEPNDLLVYSAGNDIHFYANNNKGMTVSAAGSVVVGTGDTSQSRTDNFLYIPTTDTSGAPTGTPTAYTGRAAILFNTADNKIYVYDPVQSAWLGTAALT